VAGVATMSCCRCSSSETAMQAGAPRGSTPARRAHQTHGSRPPAPPATSDSRGPHKIEA
jgi:hypothetical protein